MNLLGWILIGPVEYVRDLIVMLAGLGS